MGRRVYFYGFTDAVSLRIMIHFDDIQTYLVRSFEWIAYVFKINNDFYYSKEGFGNGEWGGGGREIFKVRSFMFCIPHPMSNRMRLAGNVARME